MLTLIASKPASQLLMWLSIHYYCSSEGRGGWSSDGIIQDNDPSLPVVCNTTHLTSFSVLVTTEEPAEVCNVIAHQ